MKKKLRQWVEQLLGLLLEWAWNKYGKPRLEKAVSEHQTVTVAKKQVPVESFLPLAAMVPHIVDGLKAGKEPHEIEAVLKTVIVPEALKVAEGVLNVFFPGVGTILQFIVWMASNSKPMTQEEENKWFDRFGAGSQS